ncbi:HAD-IIB family hydrolase [Paenibacillus humicola]|uniref:HAD-IIB family hydrolase n=1 Tax=Paenibacillus humicola TaxID=3110540 RepID=UPI00237B6A2F|nr:HAD-IIB family hydrolase [Paenibacillus humicola]
MKAIVLDLDGTLLDDRKRVSERSLSALLRIHRLGHRIIFATARPPRTVKTFLPAELLQIGAFVYYNGAQISCGHTRFEHSETIGCGLVAELLDDCRMLEPNLLLGLEAQDTLYSLNENPPVAAVVTPFEQLKRFEAAKVLLAHFPYTESVAEKFGVQLNILTTDGGTLVQIASKRASKELAVGMLCARYGISWEDTIVFGDDANDLGLLRASGWPVAMANGIDELKAAAREIAESNNQDGVAKVLERMLSQGEIAELPACGSS